MTTVPLASKLVSLLRGHGVEAEVRDDFVFMPQVQRWANLWMRTTESGLWLMEIRATGDGDEVVADRWGALGSDAESALRDGLESFSRCGFHVLLAALWGVLEEDQVEHEERQVGDRTWDLYLGPYTTRVSEGVQALVAPPAFVDLTLSALDDHLMEGDTHLLRVYVAVLNGNVTVETLVDDAPVTSVYEAVSNAGWAFPDRGFASFRWLVAARRRRGAPAHRVERKCKGTAPHP